MNLLAKRILGVFKAAVAALGIAVAGVSSADVIPTVISISNGNSALGGFPGPYATVTYNLVDSDTATFTFTAVGAYLFGAQGTAGLNFNGAVALVLPAGITGNSPCLTPYSLGGAGNEDGFGSFNFTIDTDDGANCASSSLTFSVDLLGGGTWADNAAILAANSTGSIAAAHVFAGCTGAPPNRSCQSTGYANQSGGGPPTEIPEPETLALLGMGLFGLALVRRKRRG